MSAMDWADQFAADGMSALEKARLMGARDDAREAFTAEREKAQRTAAREDQADALAFANRQHGDPLGELSRARAALAEADDECAELSARLARAEHKRDRARGNMQFFAQRMGEVTSLAQRSAPADLLGPAKQVLSEAHREFVSATRAKMTEAQTAQVSRSVSAPKADGGRGAAAAEQPYSQHPGPEIMRVCGPGPDGTLVNSALEIMR